MVSLLQSVGDGVDRRQGLVAEIDRLQNNLVILLVEGKPSVNLAAQLPLEWGVKVVGVFRLKNRLISLHSTHNFFEAEIVSVGHQVAP